jgi:hypothetical protein
MKPMQTGYIYEEKLRRLAIRCKRAYIRNTEDSIAYIKHVCEYHNVDYTELINKIKNLIEFED